MQTNSFFWWRCAFRDKARFKRLAFVGAPSQPEAELKCKMEFPTDCFDLIITKTEDVGEWRGFKVKVYGHGKQEPEVRIIIGINAEYALSIAQKSVGPKNIKRIEVEENGGNNNA